jgi:hypothetical protein
LRQAINRRKMSMAGNTSQSSGKRSSKRAEAADDDEDGWSD